MGGDHKMGHYKDYEIITTATICNDNAYFSPLNFNHKVADVMIKPCIWHQQHSDISYMAITTCHNEK